MQMNNNSVNLNQENSNVYYSYPQTNQLQYSPVMLPMQAPVQAVPMIPLGNIIGSLPVPNINTISFSTDFSSMQQFTCPVGYKPMILDPVTNTLVPLESQYVAPVTYPTEPVEYVPNLPERSESEDSFERVSARSERSQSEEGCQPGQVQKKYAFRSKQRKIDKVRGMIKDHFESQGLFAAEKELVRGEDTVRVHVKTFPGLTKIQEALNEIEEHPHIRVTRIACPFSKKNKKQKKGFIVYLKVATVEQKEMVQEIFSKYEEWLKNCVTARPRAMPVERDASKEVAEGFDLAPPVMVKVASGA